MRSASVGMMETRPQGSDPQGARRNPDGVRSAEPSMNKSLPLPTASRAQELLAITRESPSGLTWRERRSNRPGGSAAGSLTDSGYWVVRIDGKPFRAHRIIWLLHYGEDPAASDVDHINGDRADNRVENLRLATRGQNLSNTKSRHGSTSRWKGVSLRSSDGTWVAQFRHDGRHYHVGRFKCETAAALAYDRAVACARAERTPQNFN
jgi:hypothetical protein